MSIFYRSVKKASIIIIIMRFHLHLKEHTYLTTYVHDRNAFIALRSNVNHYKHFVHIFKRFVPDEL
jgi:hypothetical protein